MEDPQLLKWQAQLDEAKADLAQLGPMRPGSLSQQYRDPLTKVGAFWQLSYTHNMRSRSRHIRADELALIRPLVSNFKRFRLLVDRCVDLSVKIADRQTELRRAASVKES
jgi:DnaJ-domain-containing protein 1